jgi:hypothetical protein
MAPSSTAAYTARAIRAPHSDRGPANSSARFLLLSRQATHTASEAVPVPAKPASSTAWVFASVAVATAFTRAASVSGTGTSTTMLIVRGTWIGFSSGSPAPAGAAAQVGTRSPVVAAAVTPPSARWTRSVTCAAVSMPTPGPARRRVPASPARWAAGSIRS